MSLFLLCSILLVLLFSMILTENRQMEKSRELSTAAVDIVSAQMKARDPEMVPGSLGAMSEGSGSRIILLDGQGNPTYSTTRVLDKMKNFVAVSPDWYKAPHGPFLFPWPPPELPEALSDAVKRMAGDRVVHRFIANREGQLTPILPDGGFALRVTPIGNKPACASCHGYDENVLGHVVVVTPIGGILSPEKTLSLWGIMPFSQMNQKILAGVSLSLFGIFMLSIVFLDSALIGRKISKSQASKKKPSPKTQDDERKGDSGRSRVFSTGDESLSPSTSRPAEEIAMDSGESSSLLTRISFLEEALMREISLLPHPGIQSPVNLRRGERIEEAISTLTGWSDKVEILLLDLKTRGEVIHDPMVNRSIEKLQQLKEEAVQLGDIVEGLVSGESVPAFDTLDDVTRKWLESLSRHLQQIHGEVRALKGMIAEKVHQPTPPAPE